ncbi:MAG TPA: MCE family protein [Actinophytocola sp.]|jgi:virulence factor Mce-like protein|uniref:MCE family protein n=1 Tax=Actinophytocola sp. TaxID=1872138 RepID=UPI002F952235
MRRVGVVAAVLVVVTAGALWWIFGGDGDKRITAYFARAVGVYAGSDVQVLGVRVGTVESVTPRGSRVEVVFTLDRDVKVAADTNAVVVAPSVVSDRYVQLTGLARGGPRLPDGAVIPESRTATPVELDELYASLDTLVTALGPDGANSKGALSELLDTGADNLRGNGKALNDTVRNFAKAARTLSGSAGDLFATVDELQSFTSMLAGNDQQVRRVNDQLDQVWRTLAADRDELSTALRTLAGALADIQGFIKDNRAAIKSNVDKLARTTQLLVDHRASAAEALDVAPLAVTNVVDGFDPGSGTLQGRTDILEYIKDLPPLPVPLTGMTAGGHR